MTDGANAGGSATTGGVDFQALVTAYMSVRTLAEADAPPLWGLPANVVLSSLRAEVDHPVDDLRILTSAGGEIYIQAKTNASLSDLPTSVLGAAFDQFVRQYLATRPDRSLNGNRDRIVLATGHATGPLTDLSRVFSRLRELSGTATQLNCVSNKDESEALAKAIRLVVHFWKAQKNSEPTWSEMVPLLQLLWISVFQLEDDGSDEQLAKFLLRRSTLADPAHSDVAWKVLRIKAIGLAKRRSGVDLQELQRTLTNDQLYLRSIRSFEPDVAELREHTRRSLRSLSRYSSLRYDGHDVVIRRNCEATLRVEAEQASLLVIGDAGSGKSGLLAAVATTLVAENRDVLILNAGELSANSSGTLRSELSLRHDLIDVLTQWHGSSSAFLIIDALDSAREEKTQAMLRTLVQETKAHCPRWRVLATIRKFDLSHGRHWKRIMPGAGIRPYHDPAFDDVRHLNVTKLGEEELNSLAQSAPALHSMIASAPPAVAELVRMPFNLMLANELRETSSTSDLATVTTQLQLLDHYWEVRIQGAAEGRRREATLRRLADAMVTKRHVQVPATVATDALALETLLTRSVLVEQGGLVQFYHHILFDYGIERLLLRPDTAAAIVRLESDQDLALAAGPSIKYWLESHWERDTNRTVFWDVSLSLVASSAPAIAKVLTGTVAAARMLAGADALSLLAKIETDSGRRLFGFIADAIAADMSRLGVRTPSPWFEVINEVAIRASPQTVYRASHLLYGLLTVHSPSNAELSLAGKAARRMLEVAWAQPVRFSPAVVTAIRAVARTIESDIPESASILGRAFEPEHVKKFGHEELPWLARSVIAIAVAPELARTLYEVTFAASASPKQITSISNSQILGLTSNAQQDINGAQWELSRSFSELAAASPELAVDIATQLGGTRSSQDANAAPETPFVEVVALGVSGRIAREQDFNVEGRTTDRGSIVVAAAKQLASLANSNGSAQRVTEVLKRLITRNTSPLIWRRIIEAAANSEQLFLMIAQFVLEPSLLRMFSRQLMGGIQNHWAALAPEVRTKLEVASLALRDAGGNTAAVRLLSAIGSERLSPEGASWLKSAISTRPAARETSSEDLEEEFEGWITYGAPDDLEAEDNTGIRSQAQALLAKLPEDGAESSHLDLIEKGVRELQGQAAAPDLPPAQAADAWGAIAQVATRLSALGRDTITDLLVTAASRPEPILNPLQEEQFAQTASWSGRQARIEACEGLISIAARSGDVRVLTALETLAGDPVAAVRFHVARYCARISKRNPELFWRLVEKAVLDKNDSVVVGLIRGAIRTALLMDVARTAVLLTSSHLRRRGENLVNLVFDEILVAFVWTGNERLETAANAVAAAPAQNSGELSSGMAVLREWLTYSDESDKEAADKRRRAIGFVRRSVTIAASSFQSLTKRDVLQESDKTAIRAVSQFLMTATQELYFGSLAHDADEKPADPERRRRFFAEVKDILTVLSEVGMVASTHYLVQTLASFVDLVDPTELFLLLGSTVKAGSRGGYQYESLAVKEIVAIVERYLADFRVIFIDNADCRAAMRGILDVFVEAGWPETHKLVFSLDTIFR